VRPKLNSGGTTLATISKHAVWVDCECGRAGRILIAEVLARPNPPKTVGELVAKARCRACGRVAPTGYSIVYEGAGLDAMRGAEQGMLRREK
jgi:hypothetical protein